MTISRETHNPENHYRRIRFHEDRQLLDSELNELQDIQDLERTKLAGQIFGEGAVVRGCAATVGGADNHVLTIDAGLIHIAGHIEPVAATELAFDPAKTTGEDHVHAELLKTTVGVDRDASLINPRTLEPTAEREQWAVTLQAGDTSNDPLPDGAIERIVIPVLVFDRATATVRPAVPRSLARFDHLADAQIASPENGQLLRFDGDAQQWRNTGLPALTEMADVEAPAPADGQLLRYDQGSGRWTHSDEATDADTVDGIHASVTPAANKLLPLNENAKFPPSVIEGSVAGADNADTVDGFHASAAPTANRLLPLDGNARFPGSAIGGQVPDAAHADAADQAVNASYANAADNADTVDGFHASATPAANKLLALNANARFPSSVIEGSVAAAVNADTADGFHASATPAANKLLALNANARFPSSVIEGSVASAVNADTVDGFHASATPAANKLLALDASAKLPGTAISGQVPDAAHAVAADLATQANAADTVDGFHASATPTANRLLPLDASATLNLGGQSVRNVGKLQVGSSTVYAYNRIGSNGTGHGLSTANDLLVSGRLEVDAAVYFDGAVNASGNLTVAGNLTGYRCLVLCGYKEANTLRGDTGYYFNLQSPMHIFHGGTNGIYMPRGGSVTGLAGRFDLVSKTADCNLRLEVISFPNWAIASVDLNDASVQAGIPIGPVVWARGIHPFSAGHHLWARLHQAGPSSSQGQVQNVECIVEVTFD